MYEYKCKVTRVVDGDTVDIDIDLGFGVWLHKERVRIYGIDTPESRTRDKVEKRFGLLAKEFVKGFWDNRPVHDNTEDGHGYWQDNENKWWMAP